MAKARLCAVALALAAPLLPPVAPGNATPGPASAYVVVLQPGADPAGVAAEHARTFGFDVDFVYHSALRGYAADLTPSTVARLAQDSRVAAVEAGRPLRAQAQVVPTGVDRIEADLSATASIDEADRPRTDVDVAVLDTGIDTGHPDLNVVGGKNCAPGKGYDDHFGHGTHIAGTIAALDNGVGVVGVAPGARLWAVRVLDKRGEGDTPELLCGIDFVTGTRTDDDPTNDIEVANLSLGGLGEDDGDCGQTVKDALHMAICRSVAAGVTYVVAAGNDRQNTNRYAPGAYDEVITVSALADSDGHAGASGGPPNCRQDEDDTLANFSNFGDDVDLIAPGVCILSTLPVDGSIVDGSSGYGRLTGTSFAAPHVAGAAALYLAQHPDIAPAEVRALLIGAGSQNWDASDDPDGIKEPLVDVTGF